MDGQSRLFGHASWTFQTEADLLLSTLVGLTSIQSGHDIRNDFKSTSVPCSGGSESSTAGTFVLFCFAPILRKESSTERKFQGAKVPHLELLLPGAKSPVTILSRIMDRLVVRQFLHPVFLSRVTGILGPVRLSTHWFHHLCPCLVPSYHNPIAYST